MGTPIPINSPSVILTGAPIGNQPRLVAGTTIVAGQPVRISATDNRAYPAIATQGGDAPTQTTANVYGIALANAVAGQPFTAAVTGIVRISDAAVVVAGNVICCNAGGLIFYEELVPGDYITLIGFAIDTMRVRLHIVASGLTVPTPPGP